ncbi:transcription initiation factor TFIID subunit 7-like [Nannospalax galili]|uniref:transcription initiation factor TFIID subunit 7-like n=1 Tax=Nannospalax galili TaxID=1026970 RepID=UPI0004ED2CF0|nr:transcription initiation factor TFIID subunit 7-like [Nannospalax galili]
MSKGRDKRPFESENQFILRLPPEHASTVRKIISSGNATGKDKLKIDLSSDGRRAIVEVDNIPLSAKVVDLPCVIESLKTLDRRTFYKTADVSQMLVCSADGDLHSTPEEPVTSTDATVTGRNEGEAEKKYIWNHGITPPLKNVRKKRFRKTTKKFPDMKHSEGCSGYIDSKDVEKEVKRLLRSDAEAVSTRWEVVHEEESKTTQSQACISGLPGTPEISGRVSSEYAMSQTTSHDSSSHDGLEEKDEEDEDEEEEEEEEEDDSEENLERELQAKFMEFTLGEADEVYNSIIRRIQKLIRHKEKKIQDIQGKAQRQKDLLRKLENPTLKSHFQSLLEQLELQEKQKYEQIIFLKKQLKYLLKK